MLAGATVTVLLLTVGARSMREPQTVPASSLERRASDGWVALQGRLFTGTATKAHADGLPSEQVSYVAGRKTGVVRRWHANGQLSYEAHYVADRRDGLARTWWSDGTLRSESRYVGGVAEGVQRQWYRSGALFKEVQLVNGQESGMQRAWRENGKLYANYEARNGRTYGLRRTKLCFQLSEEDIESSSSEAAGDTQLQDIVITGE
jgi:hypothetical protein